MTIIKTISHLPRLGPAALLVASACGGGQTTTTVENPQALTAAEPNAANTAAQPEAAAPAVDQPPITTDATPSSLLPADLASVGSNLDPKKTPAQNFNLKPWKLTLPEADPSRGKNKVLEIKEKQLNGAAAGSAGFVHEQWFYSHPDNGGLVFKAPNHAPTTKNSKNTRSELREMVRAGNTSIGTKDPKNNWALAANPQADVFGGIGGKLVGTLQVDAVSKSGNDAKFAAHSVVVGQIHGSSKMEPVKIFFRKMPNHDKGSLFWNYEISPQNPDDRQDISHNVWGDYKLTKNDPSPEDGIALGERFSYVIDVTGNVLTISFKKADGSVVTHSRDMSKPYPGYDLDLGYGGDWMYFKAGAYNQCNLGTEGTWGTGCTNNGLDAGDYTQVTFYQIDVSH